MIFINPDAKRAIEDISNGLGYNIDVIFSDDLTIMAILISDPDSSEKWIIRGKNNISTIYEVYDFVGVKGSGSENN